MSRRFTAGPWSLLLVLAVASVSTAQPRVPLPDDELCRIVVARLADKDIRGIDVSVHRRVVTLRGSVPTLWTRDKAADIADRSHDDVLRVSNELTIPRGENDDRLAMQLADRLAGYVFLTVFDDAEAGVHDGVVTLKGHVTLSYKADAFADLAARVPGVQAIENHVETLPASVFDDQLRYALGRAIYGDPVFWNYAIQPNPPVHIIVDSGHVTLTGRVHSIVERRVAESIARGTFAVLSVKSRLQVDGED